MACRSSAELFGIKTDEGKAPKEEKKASQKKFAMNKKRGMRSNNSWVRGREDKIKFVIPARSAKLKKHQSTFTWRT